MQTTPHFDRRLGMVAARLEHLERVESYGIDRLELVILPREEEPAARAHLARRDVALSVHCPLFRDSGFDSYPLLASILDTDRERQVLAVELIETELRQAAEWGAGHLVAHLQRSIGILGEANPPGWTAARAIDAALEVGERAAEVSALAGVALHIENMMSQPLLCLPEHYVQLFERLAAPNVSLCLDVGHAALDAQHYGFDLLEFCSAVAPFTGSIHLYNNQIHEDFDFAALREQGRLRKVPVHPEQPTGQQWIDIPAVLETVLSVNPETLVTFEVYFALDTDRDTTRQGLEWTAELCARWWDAGG